MNLFNEFITNKMPTGLITLDRFGRITGHNPASDRIFEGKLADNTMLRDVIRESDALDVMLARCLKTGETFTRIEFNAPVTPHGDKRIGINLSPIINAEGEIEGAICLLSDLTEIVELQNQIKLKENFAALGEMSAGIAHEFKNSIATIVGYAQMSASESDVETLRGYAREVQKESQALSAMVTDFLNFARPVNTSMQETDLIDVLEMVISDLKNLRPGDYEVAFSTSTAATVTCDATLMRQVFLNLLINAVEAFADVPHRRGRITVTADHARERERDCVRIAMEDNGRGIPSHQIQKIFLPFFTTKAHGTGLGLSLVQKIVLAHNGRIEVQSSESKGTRFTLTLPQTGKLPPDTDLL
jgi:two-component system, NtrC family, sensor histidine kinase AtoS